MISSASVTLWRMFRQVLLKNRRSTPAVLLGKASLKLYRAYENHNYNFWENGEYDVLQKLKSKNLKVIFDVGANEGHWAQMAAETFPDANIRAFEVIKPTFHRLEERMKNHEITNVVTHDFGLSNAEEELTFLHSSAPEESSLSSMYSDSLNRLHPNVERVPIKGTVIKGDDYCAKHGIDSINFLKIDTEGSEHLVLQGFDRMLTEKKIDVIQFEYGNINIESKFLLYNYHELFRKLGYVVGKVYPGYTEFREYDMTTDEDFIGPNFLAVNADLKNLIGALGN
jgi:FkbM family methyltransferase